MLKRTPLFEKHVKYGGRLIDFGGWELPVQFEGILKEHTMVRENAGLFDVSHMGEIIVRGKGAEDFVQYIITNDIKKVNVKQVQYSPICYENGGCIDDLLVYKYSSEFFLLVVNAANIDKDFDWMTKHAPSELTIENVSNQFVQLALQGPKAQEILQKLTSFNLDDIRYYHFEPEIIIDGHICILSRTGYTGEDGFEIYADTAAGGALWESILSAGASDVAPIGLGARDSLRFESKMPLYGHEISSDISPLEAGLGYFVRLEKEENFLGKNALAQQKSEGIKRTLCEFEMVERGIPRAEYQVVHDGKVVGFVTTGMFAPILQKNMGLAILPVDLKEPGTPIGIVIRDKTVAAEVRKGLFYKKKTNKQKETSK